MYRYINIYIYIHILQTVRALEGFVLPSSKRDPNKHLRHKTPPGSHRASCKRNDQEQCKEGQGEKERRTLDLNMCVRKERQKTDSRFFQRKRTSSFATEISPRQVFRLRNGKILETQLDYTTISSPLRSQRHFLHKHVCFLFFLSEGLSTRLSHD